MEVLDWHLGLRKWSKNDSYYDVIVIAVLIY